MLTFGPKPEKVEPLTREEVVEGLSNWVSDYKSGKTLREMQLHGLITHVIDNKVTLEEIGLSKEDFDQIKDTLDKNAMRREKISEVQNLFRDLYIESDRFFLSRDKEKIKELCKNIKDKMEEEGIVLSEIKAMPKALKVFSDSISGKEL